MVMNPNMTLLIVLLLSGAAEGIHVLRCRSVRRLAFGPTGRPRRWTIVVPFLRMTSLGLLTWGLLTLLTVDAKVYEAQEIPEGEMNRIIIAYDVSPSMYIKDAGPLRDEGERFSSYDPRSDAPDVDAYEVKIERYIAADGSIMRKPTSRSKRAAELLESIFDRIKMQQTLVSVVAFYTDESKPVLVDCQDMRSIRNIFDDLPMKYAFRSGVTDVSSGLEGVAELAREWEPESTTLFVITDGGSATYEPLPNMPASIKNTIVIGVGKTGQGIMLDGAYSRQESVYLSNLAQRLNGTYYDGNEEHIPLEGFGSLALDLSENAKDKPNQREYAIIAIALGAFIIGFLPIVLAAYGAAWRVRSIRSLKEVAS